MVIAHEMSHMWFADLVSPVWWEDAWLNESFADYMGFEVAETVAGFAGARVSFEAAYKPGAFRADRRRSTHPVAPAAEDVPDVDTGTTIFDAISYGKGNAVLRQLVTWLGRGGLPGRGERAPHPAPVRQRHARGPAVGARRCLAARRTRLGRGVAAAVGTRHDPGLAPGRRSGADP